MSDFFQVQLLDEDRPRGRCWCGCGQATRVAPSTSLARRQFRGVPARYAKNHGADTGPLHLRLYRQLVIDPSGCLLWTGRKSRHGYGLIRIDGHDHHVHRVAYEVFVEPIPDGLEIDHVKAWGCCNRHCAAPAHLEPVTSLENKLRTGGIITAHAAATHCGTCDLPYDEENTYWTPDGHRDCRNCRRERDRQYRQRKKKAA